MKKGEEEKEKEVKYLFSLGRSRSSNYSSSFGEISILHGNGLAEKKFCV